MTATNHPIVFTDIEVRSYLPSGWSLRPGSSGRWDAASGQWAVAVLDGADNEWKVTVDARSAARAGRLEALRASIDRLQRKALGRKSVLTG